jgi:hypothetical protein
VADTLDEHANRALQAYYTAAVYLQAMWRIRLEHYLPSVHDLPDHFSLVLRLPPPQDEYGKAGLYALAEWHASHTPFKCNYVSAYDGVADLLFASLKRRRSGYESATAG